MLLNMTHDGRQSRNHIDSKCLWDIFIYGVCTLKYVSLISLNIIKHVKKDLSITQQMWIFGGIFSNFTLKMLIKSGIVL